MAEEQTPAAAPAGADTLPESTVIAEVAPASAAPSDAPVATSEQDADMTTTDADDSQTAVEGVSESGVIAAEPTQSTEASAVDAPAVASAEEPMEESYDPSAPADPVEKAAYIPSAPVEESYDPSAPAEQQAESSTSYDPSAPAEAPQQAYDPSAPAEEQTYDPSAPADEQSYDPSAPAGEPSVSYDPSVPAGHDAPVADKSHTVTAPVAPDANPPFPTIPSLHLASSHALPRHDQEYKVELPEGVTEKSPSVVANPGLVHRWRQDPSDSTLCLSLFDWAVQNSEVEDARVWYEVVAKENPTAASPLLALINLELALNNFPQVEELFARALRSPTTLMAAADVNIWKAYLHYIRRQNPDNSDTARATVIQAYDFALKECGLDRESGELWQEYITYLKTNKSKNPWDQQTQNDTLRKTFHRAVTMPLNNVESLWKQYDLFESEQNKALAKKFLADRSPAYMTARTALREMRNLTDILPHPVLPPTPDFSNDDRRVVTAWRNYLKWEADNPLASEDESVIAERMAYALRKCMAEMRHFPEMWHYAATYYLADGKIDEGANFLKAGVAACPKSFLLSFALAELEEERGNYADCHKIFDALVGTLNTEIDDIKSRVAADVEAAKGPEIVQTGTDADMIGEETDYSRSVREREERGKVVAERRQKDVDDVLSALGVVWVMYLRFARRAEGLKAARLVFGKSRKNPHVHWLAFEASAMMEYHSNKDAAVAVRIFELGLKQFSEEPDYVVKYLQFLLSINDETNARALFERSALKIPADKCRNLWETWARFEHMHGDLTAVRKLEARWAEAFPKDTPLKRFASRYVYSGYDEIALRDLGVGQRGRQPPPPPPQRFVPPPPQVLAPPMPPFAPPGRASPRSPAKRDRSPPRSPVRVEKRPRPASPPRRFRERERTPPPPPRALPPRPERPKSLEWFLSVLPPARRFDGPVFRAEDIMGLFNNISAGGTGMRRPERKFTVSEGLTAAGYRKRY